MNEISGVCPYCHQSVKPEFYFCPNCGTKLDLSALSTSFGKQIMIYLFSAVLPFIGFLFVSKWPGVKYMKAKDSKIRNVGIVACAILTLSTFLVIGLVYVGTQKLIKSSIDSINTDFSF